MQQHGQTCSSGVPRTGGRGSELPVVNRGCCGRDFGPVRDEEGPSDADVERFGSETIPCPKCGDEMYDEAEMCMACGHIVGEADNPGVPRWVMGTAAVCIGLLVLWFIL
jgi:hypothetical protein